MRCGYSIIPCESCPKSGKCEIFNELIKKEEYIDKTLKPTYCNGYVEIKKMKVNFTWTCPRCDYKLNIQKNCTDICSFIQEQTQLILNITEHLIEHHI
jgi:hypothetical protein